MKNLLLLLILASLFVNPIFSQEEKIRKHEIGLDATLLLKNINLGGGNTLRTNDFPFFYKYINPSGKGFRSGINLILQSDDGAQQGTGNRIDKQLGLGLRVGYEERIPITTKIKIYYGIDGLFDINSNTSEFDNNFDKSTFNSRRTTLGFGPALGFMYYINKRIYLSTEATYYLNFGSSTETIKFIGGEDKRDNTFYNFSWRLPVNIFVGCTL
jgi:hypothetical protein